MDGVLGSGGTEAGDIGCGHEAMTLSSEAQAPT
jgi:hypothetical protein